MPVHVYLFAPVAIASVPLFVWALRGASLELPTAPAAGRARQPRRTGRARSEPASGRARADDDRSHRAADDDVALRDRAPAHARAAAQGPRGAARPGRSQHELDHRAAARGEAGAGRNRRDAGVGGLRLRTLGVDVVRRHRVRRRRPLRTRSRARRAGPRTPEGDRARLSRSARPAHDLRRSRSRSRRRARPRGPQREGPARRRARPGCCRTCNSV